MDYLGVGKSIFTINLAISFKNKKILIIDLDILNNCLHTILGIKLLNKNKHDLKKYIIKYNKNIDLISISPILKNNEIENIKEYLNNLIKEYDYIFIDMSLECFENQNKKIMRKSYLNILLIEPNLTEIKKSQKILEMYNKEWKIKKQFINIIFNKYNINSIKEKILKRLFEEYKIIGKINFDLDYNLLINKNYNCKNEIKKIKKEYLEIIKEL